MRVESKHANKENSEDLIQTPELSTLNYKLKIGFDGKHVANHTDEIGNYGRSLIEHLADQFPVNKFDVYSPNADNSIRKHPLFSKENVSLILPPKNSTSPIWRSVGVVLALISNKVNLFHGLSGEIPYGLKENNIKSVVTIHNLFFLTQPSSYKFFERIVYKYKRKYACKHADRIIANSEQTKKDIIHFYQVDPAKIDVIYQTCDHQFKTLLGEREKAFIRTKHNLPQQYLLTVGPNESEKNLLLSIKSLTFIDPTYSLLIIGKETSSTKIIKKEVIALGLQKRVIFLKDIPFNDLPAIYQMASVFICLTNNEGSGIPIIEALYGKVPVVATTSSFLEEAGGPNSRYISLNNSEALKEAIDDILKNKELGTEMSEKGLSYAQRFNIDKISQKTMDCYAKTLAQ